MAEIIVMKNDKELGNQPWTRDGHSCSRTRTKGMSLCANLSWSLLKVEKKAQKDVSVRLPKGKKVREVVVVQPLSSGGGETSEQGMEKIISARGVSWVTGRESLRVLLENCSHPNQRGQRRRCRNRPW